MSEEPWWRTLYARQHEVWPGWSAGDGGAPQAMNFVLQLIAVSGQASAQSAPPQKVLDVGCGVGRELIELAKHGWNGTGIDVAPKLVARARARIAEAGMDEAIRVLEADLRQWQPPNDERYDLILCWDSVLAIWPRREQAEYIKKMSSWLAPGGKLIVGQLSHEHFRSVRQQKSSQKGKHIGPGHTERVYHFDRKTGVLEDRATWISPDGKREPLPTQRLHLLPVEVGVQTLREAGLKGVMAVGSDGWAWNWRGPRPPDDTSRQTVFLGRRSK